MNIKDKKIRQLLTPGDKILAGQTGLGKVVGVTPDGQYALMPAYSPVDNHFPEPVYQYKGNPVSQAGIDLGKLLFNDPLLSADSTIACASCHHQAFDFADGGKASSTGIKNKKGKRNAPGIFNVQWHPYFMADGGVNHLEVMPLAPITDSLEMGESIRQMITKLRRSTFYPTLFKNAFGTDSIYTRNVMLALAQYMGTGAPRRLKETKE